MVYGPSMRAALTTLALLGLLSAPAWAQDAALLQAKQQFAKGETHYRLGEFDKALALYRKAYKLSNRPALLFNVAQCFRQLQKGQQKERRLKSLEQAVFYYKLYLSDWKRANSSASPANAAEVQQNIDALTADMEELKQEKPEESTPRQAARSRWKRTWAWVAAGVGVVSLATGAALLATRRVDELVWQPPSGSDPGSNPYHVTDSVAPGAVLLGVGVAAGAVATYLFLRKEKPAPATVSVSPAGVWVVGHF